MEYKEGWNEFFQGNALCEIFETRKVEIDGHLYSTEESYAENVPVTAEVLIRDGIPVRVSVSHHGYADMCVEKEFKKRFPRYSMNDGFWEVPVGEDCSVTSVEEDYDGN